MKKRFLVPVALVAALALAACGKANTKTANDTKADTANEAAASGDTKELAIQVGPTPETIDPALNSSNDGGNMLQHLAEGLLKMDKNGNMIPGLAESYEVSDDGLTYTFKLRKGLKWSDGSDLTAKDFVYSWKRVADPNTAAPYGQDVLGKVKGYEEAAGGNIDALAVSAPDDTTFVVELANPVPFFDRIAAFSTLVPVQEATIEANGDAWTLSPETNVTAGPYKLAEFTDGDRIVLEKNENYWDKDSITFDKITYRLIEDPNAAYTAYKQGEVSMIKSVPSEEIPALKGTEEFHVDPLMGIYYLSFNTAKKPFDNEDVRMALALVIDRDYVANTVMQGTYLPANKMIGPGVSDAAPDSSFEKVTEEKYTKGVGSGDYEADVAKAKELLAKAGYPDGQGFPTIEYSTNDQGYHKSVAEYLQNVWKEKLGINTDIAIKEWKVFTADRRAGNYDVARNGWVMDWNDPSNLLNLFVTGSGNNDGKISIPEYDELMEKASTTMNVDERFDYLHKAEQLLLDHAALTPVAYYTDFYLQSTKLKDTWHSPYGYWFFMYGSFDK
jgi:ABC-type oligopeptide transport system, periplasmic component